MLNRTAINISSPIINGTLLARDLSAIAPAMGEKMTEHPVFAARRAEE